MGLVARSGAGSLLTLHCALLCSLIHLDVFTTMELMEYGLKTIKHVHWHQRDSRNLEERFTLPSLAAVSYLAF